MIEVKNLTKQFKLSKKQIKERGVEFTGNTVDAVSDVSFICEPGKVFTLLGPNGAGKTTTLRMIATLMEQTSGEIKICGKDTIKSGAEVRKHIGFLTGSTGLYDRLTPLEVINFYADLNEIDKSKRDKRRSELFDRFGITEYQHQRVGKLSSGMKQKVSIVRSIIHDPDVIILDEPTAALDVIASKTVIELVKELREQGKTIIFSTHIMGEVSLLSDDMAIIHKGRLFFSGTFQSFKDQMESPSLEDEFIRIVEGGGVHV